MYKLGWKQYMLEKISKSYLQNNIMPISLGKKSTD